MGYPNNPVHTGWKESSGPRYSGAASLRFGVGLALRRNRSIQIQHCSSGIGYAVATAFARRGKHLIVVARRKDRLEQLKEELAVCCPFDAAMVLEKRREFELPILCSFTDTICMIGNDLGDLVHFYGTGAEGFGIYRCGAGCLGYQHSVKLADTFTELFVNGVGINALF